MTESVLRITFLNVGHGDSIVIEHTQNDNSSFGLIDSNIVDGRIPAVDYLHSRAVKKLSFVALTHLHADHYQGIAEVIQQFPPDKLLLTPHLGHNFEDFLETRLPQFRSALEKLARRSDSAIDHKIKSLAKLLILIKQHRNNDCLILSGPENHIMLRGFPPEVAFYIIQPLNRFKGKAFQKLIDGKVSTEAPEQNEMSLAFQISFAGFTVLLNGDVPEVAWSKLEDIRNRLALNGNLVKLAHHGSDKDNTEKILKFQYGTANGLRMAAISADGSSHPAAEVLARLQRLSVAPYCTNMAGCCYQQLSKNDFSNAGKLDEKLRELLFHYNAFKKCIPCQGNIELEIRSNGEFSVNSERNTFCPNRV